MIVFLSESWPNEAWLERIRCRLCFDGNFVVKGETQGGGLVLLKRNLPSLSLLIPTHLNHIDVILDKGSENAWRLTSVGSIQV